MATLCTMVTPPAAAEPAGFDRPAVTKIKPAKVTNRQPSKPKGLTKAQQADLDRAAKVAGIKVNWPEAKSAKLVGAQHGVTTPGPVPEPSGSTASETSDVSSGEVSTDLGPVDVTAGESWDQARVAVQGQAVMRKAGVSGVAVSIAPTEAQQASAGETADKIAEADTKKAARRLTEEDAKAGLKVRLDYTEFAAAYGGDWAGRLAPRLYPACVLRTPEKQACQESIDLATERDATSQSLSAKVPASALAESQVGADAVVLFASSGDSSTGSGDFTASPLAGSSSWSVGGSSGGFSWSYPLSVTAPAAGSAPALAIEYSSQTVDGMTATTNNQASVLGEGFDLSHAYIERSYVVCDADGRDGKGDQCWKTDNATLAMAGAGGELVKAANGTWRLANDDGTRVRRIATAADSTNTRVESDKPSLASANPDNNNEYWEVTRPDGTRLYFGRSRVPGQSEDTNSVWTTPIYGNNDGEPCYEASTGANSHCRQAWRWNLDYVVDTSGNGTAYRYAEELNNYRLNNTTPTQYTRGGRLVRVDYGLRNGTDGGTSNDAAPYRVAVNYATRCLAATGCETYSASTWPDTPYDQLCADGAECTGKLSPTFFTRNRLNKVTAQTRINGAYTAIDEWDFDYSWVNPDNQQASVLWLNKITRTGKAAGSAVGADVTLPPITFTWESHDNRVNSLTDGISPLTRYRMDTITSEAGGRTSVQYAGANCSPSNLPSSAASNTQRCFPVKWTPDGVTAERTDWFHKYVVSQVSQVDTTGDGDPITTFYNYDGGAAWAYNDSKLVPEKYRTWSQWRGYETVRTVTGDPLVMTSSPRTETVATYFRGMDGDRANVAGDTRNVTVTDSAGSNYADDVHLAGTALETTNLTGVGGSVHIGTINKPWVHVTAGSGLRSAAYTGTASTVTRQASSAGGFRTRKIDYTHDETTGLVTRIDDHGDTAVSNDQTCTATSYAGARTVDDAWMVGFATRQAVSKGLCGTDAMDPSEADTIAHTRTRYDGGAQGDAPTKGLVTETDRVKGFTSTGAPIFQTTGTFTHDAYGRQATAATPTDDGAGTIGTSTDTTTYTHTADGTLATEATTQDSGGKAFTTTTTYTPERSIAAKVTDPNNKSTSAAYDALGRTVSVWANNRVTTATPTLKYAYKITPTSPLSVTTSSLNRLGDGYRTSVEFYDSLYRPRQVQVASPGGRMISGALYDSMGNADRTYERLFTTGAPSDTLAVVNLGSASKAVYTEYDGLARPIKITEFEHTDELSSTTMTYTGADKAKVTPPNGAPATTGYTDIRGQQVKQIEHGSTSARDLTTAYTYDLAGQMTEMDSSAGKFSWGYDIRGRKTSQTDLEAGTTQFTYTETDQLATTTDSRGKSTTTVYDQLGRPTGYYDGTSKDVTKQLTSWTYDSPMKGLPSTTTRYVGGTTGARFNHKVTAYDNAYHPIQQSFTITGTTVGTEQVTKLDDGLPASLTHQAQYNAGDQTLSYESVPAVIVGGTSVMSSETVRYNYDDLGNPTSMTGTTSIVRNIGYDSLNRPSTITLGHGPDQELFLHQEYQDATGRLTRSLAVTSLSETVVSDHHYTYDAAGNPLTDHDRANADAQCYTYDDHQRLTAAWTPANADCATSPASAVLGGPSPYRQSWTYTANGLRKTQTSHLPAVGTTTPATEVTDTYAYPAAGSAHANFATGVTRTNTATSEVIDTDAYTFDDAGNTLTRPGVAAQTAQELTWNSEGDLASLTVKGEGAEATTSYLYGADGTLLVKDSPSEKTLMAFGLEITVDKTISPWTTSAARHYDTPVGQVAVRDSANGLSFQLPNAHGTALTSLDAATLTPTRRYMTPYGEDRAGITGATGAEETDAWPTSRGFLNMQADDATGLTSVGARQYDARMGRFLSVDPLLDADDPHQALGYVYANNNPMTWADPTGLGPSCLNGIGGQCGYDGTSITWYDSDNDGDAVETGTGKVIKTPTGNSNTSNGGTSGNSGGTKNVSGGQTGPSREELEAAEEAQATLNRSIGAEALKVGWEVLKDFIGYNDLVSCLDKDYKACVGLVLGSIPWGKAFKAGKALYRIGKAAAEFIGQQKAARKLLAGFKKRYQPGCNSFTGDTLVLLADGRRIPIKDVRVGDWVWATNPVTGVEGPRPVTNLIRHSGPHVMASVQTADGAWVDSTDNHPFWVDNRGPAGDWVPAINLRIGDLLQTSAGTRAQVTAVDVWAGDLTAYNLTVAGLHTYHVGAGDLLVHNEDPVCTISASRRASLRQAKRDLGIPNSQNPDGVRRVPMTDRNGRQIMNDDGTPVNTREYDYSRGGETVVIQDHSAGHQFGEGGVGDQGPHFNVRPSENTRTGKVSGTAEHYAY